MGGAAACVPHVRLTASASAVCAIQVPGSRKLCWPAGPDAATRPAREVWVLHVVDVCDACAVTASGSLACGGEGNSNSSSAIVAGGVNGGDGGGGGDSSGEVYLSVAQSGHASVCALLSNWSIACFNSSTLAPLLLPGAAPPRQAQ